MLQDFSERALDSLIYAADAAKRGVLSQKHLRRNYVRWIAQAVADGNFTFGALHQQKKNSFVVYKVKHLGDELVLRQLATLIRKAYGLKQPDRHSVSKQVRTLLAETTFKHIVKLDIAKFYESIDRDAIIARLKYDGLLSRQAIAIIQSFFLSIQSQVPTGVPRGLGLSAILAELCLSKFDKALRSFPGVYFAIRYVDDILVLSMEPGFKVRKEVEGLLPKPLVLNADKCLSIQIGCRCYHNCIHASICPCAIKCQCHLKQVKRSFSYLGYHYSLSPATKKVEDPANVIVSIAKKKIDRIKRRIICACKDHIRSQNFPLLFARLRFLTENHRIRGARNYGKLTTGIGFNYSLLTSNSDLVVLDEFLRSTVSAAQGSFGLALSSSLTAKQWRSLLAVSFVSGHRAKRRRKLTPAEAREIRACWSSL